MSLITQPYPFRRLLVDQMIRGTTRVWWSMHQDFNDPGDHTFQLQFGNTGSNLASDWVDVGLPVVGAYYATDSEMRNTGMVITAHYRVVLITAAGTYVSDPVNPTGYLTEHDHVLSREILRKEELRFRLVASAGTILKRLRYGRKCPNCRDQLTGEQSSICLACNGTGFAVGYHPPVKCAFMDLSPQQFDEKQDAETRGTIRDGAIVTARVSAFPALQKYDVWINDFSDERWVIHQIKHEAVVRGVPLVSTVRMHLAPFTHIVYRVEINGESAERSSETLPVVGDGSVTVDHNYGGDDTLTYQTDDGCGISGATILVFTKEVWDAITPGPPLAAEAVATSSTDANGRWATAVKIDPGEYVVMFHRLGVYGPNSAELTVVEPVEGLTLPVEDTWEF